MGIRANELRIGNKVLMEFENVIEVVDSRMIGFIAVANRTEKPHPFVGIQLNEEILLNVGYEYEGEETGLYLHNDWSLSENAEGGFEVIINHEYWITIHVDYLHELQNTIWALSSFKKELEVNL